MGQAVPETKRDSLPCPSFEGCRRASRAGSCAVRLTARFAATPDWSGGGRSFSDLSSAQDDVGFQPLARIVVFAVSTPPRLSLTRSRTVNFLCFL